MSVEDPRKFDSLVQKENSLIQDLFSIWSQIEDQQQTLRAALEKVSTRGAALRLLLLLDDDLKKFVFTDLVELASVGHSDISLCRVVIKSLPRAWLIDNVGNAVDVVLASSGDSECYRRLAELIVEIDNRLLKSLVSRASKSASQEVLEVAEDFRKHLLEGG